MFKHCFLLALCLIAIVGCKKDQLTTDVELIKADLAAKGITALETPEQIFYVIDKDGTGDHPTANNTVKVAYRGSYLDGVVFDQTTPANPSITYPLTGLITGWQYAVPLLKKSGKGTFWIPSELAYGSNPPPGVRKNAVMIFDIELIDFK
jgi:FKBP-type peptidyl-prolyl cis-trans isomerase FkpA